MKLGHYKLIILVAVLTLIPMAAIVSHADPDGGPVPLHKQGEYPRGWVDWIEGNQIVIDDTQYEFTPGTRILDINNRTVSKDYMKVAMRVVFEPGDNFALLAVQEMSPEDDQTLSENEIERTSEAEQATDTAPAPNEAPEGIYQEGGVWKN